MSFIYNFTDTWNDGAVVFNGIKLNVTDTASDAASLLMNLQVAGSTKFSIGKGGDTLANSLALGGATVGANALAVTGQITNAGGTITASQPFTLTQTWNAGGVTFNSLLVNATSTASASASTLIDLQLAGTTQFNVDKSGYVSIKSGWQVPVSGNIDVTFGGNTNAALDIRSAGRFGWTSGASALGVVDTNMSRASAGVQQFGTNAANAAGSWLATNGTLSGVLTLPNGAVGTLALNFGSANAGIYGASGSGNLVFVASAVNKAYVGSFFQLVSTAMVGWTSSSSDPISGFDTGISRSSAGVVQVGTTAANALGSLLLTTLTATGTVSTSSTTDATTTTSGSIQTLGGMAVRKRVFMDGLTASAGLQTAVICQSSAGELIADSVACLASSARFKDLLGDAEKGALDKIIRVPVQRWKYRREEGSVFPDNYYSEHIGPTAEDIEAIDSRLVGRDKEGKARSISTDQLLALAIQAIQEQQVQIEELKARAA